MTLIEELSLAVGDAFAAAGLDTGLGRVKPADRPDLAQFQCNGALAAAKAAGQNPRALAEQISTALAVNPLIKDVTVAGPGFINICLTDEAIAAHANDLSVDEKFGGWTRAIPEKVVMDYGGPNVAKALHVGHLRAAIIGESLKRIFRFVGDEVIGDVHLGDWGLPMGQLITELQIEQPDLPYFDASITGPYPDQSPVTIDDLARLYPKASIACKADKERAEIARLATAQLQNGRPGYRALWRHFVAISRETIEREYADLGVTFDLWKGEADADPLIADMAEDLRAQGLLEESDGAQIVHVTKDTDNKEIPPLMLFKSDGGVTYGATDLATIIDRIQSQDPGRIIYVVDQRQSLHFEQVFRAAERAKIFPHEKLEHIAFGTMQGKDRKPFKTRSGDTVKLRDMIDMVTDRAGTRLADSGLAQGYGEAETADIANKVGIAALKFADLSNPRISDYIFDLDRFMAFEGKTGPYLLYAVVRARSVLAKAKTAGAGEVGPITISASEERDLCLTLLAFGDAIRDSYSKRMPNLLCDHAFNLAQAFSKFYAACRMVDEPDDSLRASRLNLARITGEQLGLVLQLLGIETPARM